MSNFLHNFKQHAYLHKCLAILLSALMIFSLMPMTVFAEDTVIAQGQCGNTASIDATNVPTNKIYCCKNKFFII